MKEDLFARLSRRYLALDIHKHYSVVDGVNFEGKVVLEAIRIEHADLEGWLAKHIQSTDYVVIESTTPFGPGARRGETAFGDDTG